LFLPQSAFGSMYNEFSQFASESHQSQSFSQFSNSFNPLVNILGGVNPSFSTLGQF
jgi:hypothetical protein